MNHADYSIELADGEGRKCRLYINGACIDELVAAGVSLDVAVEDVESNAFHNAISRNEIGGDAWIVSAR